MPESLAGDSLPSRSFSPNGCLMALRIAQLGQPILRDVSDEIPADTIADPAFQDFLDEMIATMRAARGVGLAAPQVFDRRRVFIADILPPPRPNERAPVGVFINPKLSQLSEETVSDWEGCLSFLELSAFVPRSTSLRIDYLDRQGTPRCLELKDFPARVVQHEYDHLEGILTIDRVTTSRNIIKSSESDDAREY